MTAVLIGFTKDAPLINLLISNDTIDHGGRQKECGEVNGEDRKVL